MFQVWPYLFHYHNGPSFKFFVIQVPMTYGIYLSYNIGAATKVLKGEADTSAYICVIKHKWNSMELVKHKTVEPENCTKVKSRKSLVSVFGKNYIIKRLKYKSPNVRYLKIIHSIYFSSINPVSGIWLVFATGFHQLTLTSKIKHNCRCDSSYECQLYSSALSIVSIAINNIHIYFRHYAKNIIEFI